MEVMTALLELDCIPCGMEYFPASDETQWSFIQRLIDRCDYYVVIIGGLYGSLAPDGLSYTQKEYEYAVSKGIPTLAFTYHNVQKLPRKHRERDEKKKRKLKQFVELVKGHLCKEWRNADHLAGVVTRSLNQLISTRPRAGWVRANSFARGTGQKAVQKRRLLTREKQPARLPFSKEQFGNIYWVAHDLLWTVAQFVSKGSREKILEGLFQSKHHLNEVRFVDSSFCSRLERIYQEALRSSESDWTAERRGHAATEIQSFARELGGIISANQLGFNFIHRRSASHSDLQGLSRNATAAFRAASIHRPRVLNPNGIPSLSPGLDRDAGLPWVIRQKQFQPQRGCIASPVVAVARGIQPFQRW
jgi:hypothetical protein